jgi:hypothetical protein
MILNDLVKQAIDGVVSKPLAIEPISKIISATIKP